MKLITLLLAIALSSVAIAAPVMTKKVNSDGTVTYDPVGDPKAGSPETVPQKLSKEIDKQAKEVGVQVIDITSKPVMTKKVNSNGTVTYDPVGDPKAGSPETVPQKLSKEIDKQAKEVGVQVIDITSKPVMTKKVNSDGTITYDPIDPKADFTETVPKKKGKEVDEKLKELGVKVIDITPKK